MLNLPPYGVHLFIIIRKIQIEDFKFHPDFTYFLGKCRNSKFLVDFRDLVHYSCNEPASVFTISYKLTWNWRIFINQQILTRTQGATANKAPDWLQVWIEASDWLLVRLRLSLAFLFLQYILTNKIQ